VSRWFDSPSSVPEAGVRSDHAAPGRIASLRRSPPYLVKGEAALDLVTDCAGSDEIVFVEPAARY
jgi:hypothetical protein